MSNHTFKDLKVLLKTTYKEWNNDDTFMHAAAVSYYAIFSLPAILIIIIDVAGIFLGKQVAQGKLSETLTDLIGSSAAQQIQSIALNSTKNSNSNLMIIIGLIILIISATGLVMQLRKALNRLWEVKTRKDLGILYLITDRVKTFSIIIAIGLLLFLSVAITGILSVFTSWLKDHLPGFTVYLFHLVNVVISLGLSTFLFAMLFKFLPDIKISFKSVWIGAIVTSVLFLIGEYGMTIYFSIVRPDSSYGVAGSIVIILLWVYYSCLLLFFGAEFTQSYAEKHGHKIEPSKNSIKIIN